MAAADVQLAPGTPGTPGTWPACGPVCNRTTSPFPLHRSAPASRLPSISSSPRHASMRNVNVAHLVAKAAPRSSTEMMVPTKAASQPVLPEADECAATQQAAAQCIRAFAPGDAVPVSGTPAMPVQSTSTGTPAASAAPSHSKAASWAAFRSGSLDDDLDSAMLDLAQSGRMPTMPDDYSLPEFPGQQAAGAAAADTAPATAEDSLEHVFDSMGLDDAPGARTAAPAAAVPAEDAFAHSHHGAPAAAAPAAAAPAPSSSTQGGSDTQPYVLVRLDDQGNILRQANADDIAFLTQLLSDEAPAPSMPVATVSTPKVPRRSGGVQKRTGSSGGTRKPGGPCCHCGVKESPQWRRGPTSKPILCNACGTRYRRTHQLGATNNKSKASPAMRKGTVAAATAADTQP